MREQVRIFAVSQNGVTAVLQASDGLSQAYDVLHAAGLVTEDRLRIVAAAERDGRDPVAFAHHLVSLCSAVQS